MYVAPIFDRMPPVETGFPSDAQRRTDRLDRERREFIRTAAVAIMANLPLHPDLSLSRGAIGLYAEEAVARAQALWLELQDEDC